MNGKTGIIIAAVAAVILLGIGGFVYTKNFMSKSAQENLGSTADKKTSAGTLFSSIQDALSKNLTLQCDFKDVNGQQTTTYIKNGMIRANVTGKTVAESGTVIMRDNKMYFWNDKNAIVLEFDMKNAQNNAGVNVPAGAGTKNPQDYVAMMEKYKESCKTALVGDGLFTIPTDVKFQDLTQMMKSLQNSAGSNSGAGVPSINPSNYQQMMKQYQDAVQD